MPEFFYLLINYPALIAAPIIFLQRWRYGATDKRHRQRLPTIRH
jgi:hypothetical protein